ncbi:hypothetical protein EYF80_032413 [Liparis tanakae]|uniref:Uncharacterized protein n=1 Tax=Liparis tanakae TaxID=230148 RepID=A0A4Z2GUP7_9TELE|nr:hypothetical protein EYF80_032413 [Liparis tanakae]
MLSTESFLNITRFPIITDLVWQDVSSEVIFKQFSQTGSQSRHLLRVYWVWSPGLLGLVQVYWVWSPGLLGLVQVYWVRCGATPLTVQVVSSQPMMAQRGRMSELSTSLDGCTTPQM